MGFYLLRDLKDGINYLNGGNAISQEMLTTFENHLIAITEDIFSEDFTQTEDEKQCTFCPYNRICFRGK